MVINTGLSAQVLEYVGSYDNLDNCIDVFVKDNYVYMSGVPELRIFDVSNLSDPILVGSYDSIGFTREVVVQDNIAYVTGGWHGLRLLDISDPTHPLHLGSYTFNQDISDINIKGNIAYIPVDFHGLHILNVTDPSNPYMIGHYDTLLFARSVDVVGDYAYLIDGWYSMLVIDVSDITAPEFYGSYREFDYVDISVAGQYAYITDLSTCLQILDISDPENPTFLSSLYNSGYHPATDVHLFGHYVLIAASYSGLMLIDVADPSNQEIVDIYDPGDYISGVYVKDDLVYIAAHTSLIILRLSMTETEEDVLLLPVKTSLAQNHPNPFNATTVISYGLQEAGLITLSIYNLIGQRVATIYDGIQRAGEHNEVWDASDFPSGVYFARLEAQGRLENVKMVLLK